MEGQDGEVPPQKTEDPQPPSDEDFMAGVAPDSGSHSESGLMIFPLKPPPPMQVNVASSGLIYTTTSSLNYKESAINVGTVKDYFKTYQNDIAYVMEIQEPGLLKVQLLYEKEVKLDVKKKTKVFKQTFFSCGICLAIHSDRKHNVITHLGSCAGMQNEKQQKRIIKNRSQQKWRKKRKIEAAMGGRPMPSYYAEPSLSTSGAQQTPVDNQQDDPEVVDEDLSVTSDEQNDEQPDTIVCEARNCDTYVNLGGNRETLSQIFDVRDLNFVRSIGKQFQQNAAIIWKPDLCPSGVENNEPCSVHFHGFTIRTRVFALPLPFFLRHRQLICKTHNTTFSYLCDAVANQLPIDVFLTEDVVVFERTVMSREFLHDLTREYEAYFNTTRIHKTITLKWVDSALIRLDGESRRNLSQHFANVSEQEFEVDVPDWEVLKPLRCLTPALITKIIQAWWYVEREEMYQSWKLDFFKNSRRISGDHTYKCVRNLGTYEVNDGKKEWVGVKASLYTILNQDGHLVDFKLCPTDAFVHVEQLLGNIWSTQAVNDCHTTQFHTDIVAKDRNQILRVFADNFPNTVPPPVVAQDLYHAEQRVERKMNKSSKRFYMAKVELRSVFSAFKKSSENGGYGSREDVVEAFQNWVYRFMSDMEETLLSEEDQLRLVGASLSGSSEEDMNIDDDEEEDENEASFVDDTFLKDFSEEHLSLLFPSDIFARALDYVSKVSFCKYTCEEGKHLFRCGVTSTQQKVYFVTVSVSAPSEGLKLPDRIQGRCTCPHNSMNCKHFAAGLLSWKRNPSKWELGDADVVEPGKFCNGPVTLDTVTAVNNILKPNVLPYLMVLGSLTEKRGTTLNENFHRFVGAEIGTTSGICSIQQKEMDLKMCHMKFNRRQKTHAALLKITYVTGCTSLQTRLVASEKPSYLLHPKLIQSLSKKDLQEMGFRTKRDQAVWTAQDIQLLKSTLVELYSGEYQILSKNPYYWIAHHTFDDTKTEKDVKQYVMKYFMNFNE